MGLGEISKNSKPSPISSRTAEVAGQNLAHVNDESYARQRVLAKEGVMYTSAGGLLTSQVCLLGESIMLVMKYLIQELLVKKVFKFSCCQAGNSSNLTSCIR